MIGFGRQVMVMTLVIIARKNYTTMQNNNTNLTLHCVLHEPAGALGEYLDHRWTMILQFMNALSDLMITIGVLEFFCAQVPYSMKGLVVGAAYGWLIVYASGFGGIEQLFKNKSFEWDTGVLSCTFWHSVTILSSLTIIIIITFVAMKFYKKRKREDVLPNEQIFAERYYSM